LTECKNECTQGGYRWRDELVTNLLPYVKDGIDRKFLNNVVRGYVPTFFPTKIPPDNDANWLSSLYVRPNNFWWKREIENIGKEFSKESDHTDHNLLINIFRKYDWKVDTPFTYVKGISCLNKKGRWKYDALKDRIAVEVEFSNRYHIFKDTLKFLIGQSMDQIDTGIIIVPKYLEKNKQPYLGWIDPNSHPIFTTLPMLKVAFYGLPNRVRKSPTVNT